VLVLPFLAELWLWSAAVLMVWLVIPVVLVARGRIGAAAILSVAVSIAWIAASVVLFSASDRVRWAVRDGQTWVSLLWLASAVGALGSIAFSSVLLMMRKHLHKIKVAK